MTIIQEPLSLVVSVFAQGLFLSLGLIVAIGAQNAFVLRQGLRRAWWGACRDEGLNPRQPVQLPLLFALDAELGIPGGYRYVPDCRLLGADRGDTHCAAALACGGSSGGGNDGDADGGGDGGGCGGGGD